MTDLTELSLRSSSLVWIVPHWIGELTSLQVRLFGFACRSPIHLCNDTNNRTMRSFLT